MSNPNATDRLQLAQRGAVIGIFSYIVLALIKLSVGHLIHSSSLMADGFNNFSDILSNVTIWVGLKIASKPADYDHKFGHWKMENLASLITSIIMFMVGFEVLKSTVDKMLGQASPPLDPLGAWVGAVSALIMLMVYRYNHRLAKQVNSPALAAAAKDHLADALTSLGTSIAILASALRWPILDQIVALLITLLIFKTAFGIFKESIFTLSDGFDEGLLEDYALAISQLDKVDRVISQRGRTYGSNIYLDVVIAMNPDLSVYESHEVTEEIEQLLQIGFGVFDVDVHVEPSEIPHDEIYEHVFDKLYRFEAEIQAHEVGYQHYLSEDYLLIDAKGRYFNKAETLERHREQATYLKKFQMISISQKSKLVTFEIDGYVHTSIWRRHVLWQVVFHQISKKAETSINLEEAPSHS